MKDETLLPCPFCGATQDGIEFAETSSGEFCVCCDECSSTGPVRVSKELAIESWNRRALQSGNSEAIQDFLRVLDEYPEQLVPINRNSAVVRALRNAAVGNSAQPVKVPDGYVLVPVEPTPEMIDAYRNALYSGEPIVSSTELYKAMLAAAPKSPGRQLTPAPEDRLQKAIVDACMVFLHGCDSLSKNYECDFSDSETELYFCIANVAKKIGVVEETGNRRWSLSQQMRDEIGGVYRKYAMRIMEAAPKVTP